VFRSTHIGNEVGTRCPFDTNKSSRYRRVLLLGLHVAPSVSSEIRNDVKAAVIDMVKGNPIKGNGMGGNNEFTILTDVSEDVIEIEGVQDNEDELDLPAPYPAMAR
jgi:hypothetical protein